MGRDGEEGKKERKGWEEKRFAGPMSNCFLSPWINSNSATTSEKILHSYQQSAGSFERNYCTSNSSTSDSVYSNTACSGVCGLQLTRVAGSTFQFDLDANLVACRQCLAPVVQHWTDHADSYISHTKQLQKGILPKCRRPCLCGSLAQCALSLKRLSAGPGFNPQTRQNKLFHDYWRACFEINFSDRQEGLTVSSNLWPLSGYGG